MSSRIEQIHNILTKLKAGHDGVEGCILVTAQGLPIDSATDGRADEDLISAMTASISSVSERVTQELGKGQINNISILGENGYIILLDVASRAVLTVLAKTDANLGLILLLSRRSCGQLAELI
ncbi:MAG TPA: roadblock/LC7 domain-containing protein [candidate division Zixibacteria bacterium]|nr:roadblock/LC7 domain-containing protein [candidate division Zixibacteria bacterium]